MQFSKSVIAVLLGAGVAAIPVFAQEEGSGKSQQFSIQGYGSFLKSTNSDGVRQGATDTGGVLASYRYFFNNYHGVEVNYGFNANTQTYGFRGSLASLDSNNHELSAAYVIRFPRLNHVTPFALAGVGGLVFNPDVAGIGSEARAAFVYGGGADVNFTKHLFMRAEYRGFVYNSPTYDIPALSGLDRVTHLAQPSLGFGYRF